MTPLLAAGGAVAALAVQAVWGGVRTPRFRVLKPLATALILGATLQIPGPLRTPLAAGLALSLVGDLCLLGTGNPAFLGGLGSFLLAHLAFIAALLQGLPWGPPPIWTLALLPVGVGILGGLWGSLGRLRGPVVGYTAVLVAMVLAAARGAALRGTPGSRWALAGAMAFLASDALLAWDRFRGPVPRAQPVLLTLYWGALLLIVAGCAA